MSAMSPNTKRTIFIASGIVAVIIIGAIVYSSFTKQIDDTPQGFNEMIEKVGKKNPAILAWWESLPLNKQIQIESTITPEILTMMYNELTKSNPSEQSLNILRKLGYQG